MRACVILSTILILAIVALWGCSGNEAPVADKGAAALSPAATIAEIKAKNKPADIAYGKNIELNSCGKCHVHYPPEMHTVKEWDALLPRMIPRAMLGEADAQKLRAYLLVNCKQ